MTFSDKFNQMLGGDSTNILNKQFNSQNLDRIYHGIGQPSGHGLQYDSTAGGGVNMGVSVAPVYFPGYNMDILRRYPQQHVRQQEPSGYSYSQGGYGSAPGGYASAGHSGGYGVGPPPPPPNYVAYGAPRQSPKRKLQGTALSALTLLAFLFFLNLLQTCLKDQMVAMNPTVLVMTAGNRERNLNIDQISSINDDDISFVEHKSFQHSNKNRRELTKDYINQPITSLTSHQNNNIIDNSDVNYL